MLAANQSNGQDHIQTRHSNKKTTDDQLIEHSNDSSTISTINQATIQKELIDKSQDKHSNNDDNNQLQADEISKTREQKGMALLKAFVLEVNNNFGNIATL